MRLEQYESISNKTKTIFTFISEGPKGKIVKRIEYTKMKIEGIKNFYNLGFGDIADNSSEINDLSITDNQDRDKVLATVVNSVYKFSERHPKAKIYITGSTDARIRLYRIVIDKYFDELSETFTIKGITKNGIFSFEKNMPYEAFLITLKKNKL